MNIINNFKESLENGKIRSAWERLKIFILYQTSEKMLGKNILLRPNYCDKIDLF